MTRLRRKRGSGPGRTEALLAGALLLLASPGLPSGLANAAATGAGGGVGATATKAAAYSITGTVLNARDGAPVAGCRLSVTRVRAPLVPGSGAADAPADDIANGSAAVSSSSPVTPGVGTVSRGRVAVPRTAARSAVAPPLSAETDARGRFTLPVEGAGMWRLSAQARGFRAQALDEHEGFSTAVAVTDARPTENVQFRLVPDAVVEGVVIDEAGEPVRQAQVNAHRVRQASDENLFQGMVRAGFAQTDDRGHYEMAGLPPGVYKLSATARPWYATPPQRSGGVAAPAEALDPSLDVVYAPAWYPGGSDPETAGTVDLRTGEDREADFHLEAVPAVHLRVTAGDTGAATSAPPGGRIMPGQAPQILSSQGGLGPGFGWMGQMTGFSENTWDIGGLAPGKYQVRLAGSDGKGERLVSVTLTAGAPMLLGPDSGDSGTSVTINVEGSAAADVRRVLFVDPDSGQTFTAEVGRTQNRYVRQFGSRVPAASEPAADAAGGQGKPASHSPASQTPVSQPISQTISVPPHRYVVYLGASNGAYLSRVQATGATAAGRSVTIGGGTPTVTVEVSRGSAEVTGIARLPGSAGSVGAAGSAGEPGVMALLVPVTFGQSDSLNFAARDQTNSDGSFVFSDVRPGQYILIAIEHGWNLNWRDPSTLAPYLAHGVPVSAEAGQKLRRDVDAVAP